MENSDSHPVQVAIIEKVDSTSVPKLNIDQIKRVIRDSRIEDVPVLVISVAGVARSGKSFLMNLMIHYLTHISQQPDTDFKASGSVISGMEWAGGRRPITKGIWLWNKAFIINRGDSSKVAIMLLDMQGIGNDYDNVDSQIIYATHLMSNVCIHNINKSWKVQEREVYQNCHSLCETYGGVDKAFNSLVMLYRNWCEDDKFGARPDVVKNEISDSKTDGEVCKFTNAIEKLFHHVSAWVLPEPSTTVRKGQGDISLTDIGEDFCNEVNAFFNALFSSDGYYQKLMDCTVTGREYIKKMEAFSEQLEIMDWQDLTIDAEYFNDLFVRNAYKSGKDIFQELVKSIMIESTEDFQELDKWLNKAEKCAMEHFKAKNSHGSYALHCYYLDKLRRQIKKKRFSLILQAHVRIKEKRIQQLHLIQKQSEDIEYQMKLHEEQLLEVRTLKGIGSAMVSAATVVGTVLAAVPHFMAFGAVLKSALMKGIL